MCLLQWRFQGLTWLKRLASGRWGEVEGCPKAEAFPEGARPLSPPGTGQREGSTEVGSGL